MKTKCFKRKYKINKRKTDIFIRLLQLGAAAVAIGKRYCGFLFVGFVVVVVVVGNIQPKWSPKSCVGHCVVGNHK